MRFAAFLIVGPGEGDRHLERVLTQLWTDDICICLNNADEKTARIARKYATLVREDDREWGVHQWRIKQDFLRIVQKEVSPDWVWCLDADEIFPGFTKEKALELAGGHDIAYYFWCLQLWDSEGRVRLDLCFPNIRFYKLIPDWLDYQATALHCGLAPRTAYQYGSQSDQYFLHLGLMDKESRERKIARYDKYDPDAKYKAKSWYDGLRNEKARTVSVEEALRKLPETIRRKKFPTMSKKEKKVHFFRNKHNKIVPAVGEKQRDQFLKRGMVEVESIKVTTGGEAPVVKKHEGPRPEKVAPVREAAPTASTPKKRGRPRKKKGGDERTDAPSPGLAEGK